MTSRIVLVLWVVVLFLAHCTAPLQASPQHAAPIKKKGLIEALGIGGLPASDLIDLINQRGVNFRLAYDDEEELRNAGASPAVLEAIRKHYHGTPVSQADKTNAASLLKTSRALLDAQDANSALPVVLQALTLDQDDADAYILRGRIYLATTQPKKAEVDFHIALQIAPGNAEAKRFLATAENPGSGVVAPASASLEIPPAGHTGYLGFHWGFRNGQYYVAGVLPTGSGARGGLLVGDVLVSANGLGMKDFADQYVTPAKITPGMTVQLQVQRQGQPLELQLVALPRPLIGDEALNYLGQVIQQYPGNTEAYLYRASAYEQLKNYKASLDDWNMYVRLAPQDPLGYGERAKVKTVLGDQVGAKADQDEAARLLPPSSTAAPSSTTPPPALPPGLPARTPGSAPATNPAGTPAAMGPFPERWNLLQFNKNFTMRLVADHLYMQSIDSTIVADAEKTTDKKGIVVYKGKWRQKNANGTFSQWNMTLKTVTPESIDGTVLTLIFSGVQVTFMPQK
jgi:tetratricopeptide (TPR) repeat protein